MGLAGKRQDVYGNGGLGLSEVWPSHAWALRRFAVPLYLSSSACLAIDVLSGILN